MLRSNNLASSPGASMGPLPSPRPFGVRRLRRLLLAAFLLVAASSLGGCLDIEEELLITPAGSGSVRFHYSTRASFLTTTLPEGETVDCPGARYFDPAWIRKAFDGTGAQVGEIEAANVGEERQVNVLVHFARLADLQNAPPLAGFSFDLRRDGDKLFFSQRIEPSELAAAVQGDRLLDPGVLVPLFEGRRAVFRVHVPGHSLKQPEPPGGRVTGSILERMVNPGRVGEGRAIRVDVEARSNTGARVGALVLYAFALAALVGLAGPLLFGRSLPFRWSM
ncbi:MAG: hypothetical protein HYZ53_30315 [Planctomycetes bacterium]|nr:hypothetical protein [Planctomycetota bacterium]